MEILNNSNVSHITVQPTIISKFRHVCECQVVFSIFPLDKETAIIHRLRSPTNEIVMKDGTIIKSLKHSDKFNSFATSGNGEYFASNFYSHRVKKIDLCGQVWDFINVFPYRPCSLCTTGSGDILVGAIRTEVGENGVVLVLNERDGQINKTEIKEASFGQGPMRITENINRDICMITTPCKDEPHAVKIYSKDWNLKAEFGTDMFKDGPFRPFGLCCDRYGNILVANTGTNHVLMLDSDCHFREFLTTEDDGITGPRCLAMDPSGQIWLGYEDGMVYILDY